MSLVNGICGTHAPRPHNEYVCHGTVEQRHKILKNVKCFLKQFDNRKCVLPDTPIHKTGRNVVYNPSELATPNRPLITNTGVMQIRLTSDPNRVADDPPDIYYKAAPNLKRNTIPMNTPGRKKSVELKGGIFYGSCFCVKRNGLQGDCPRSDCMGRPECLAISPGPCCEPALAYYGKQMPSANGRRDSEDFEHDHSGYKCSCCHRF